ncbi:hypothetical protein NSK_003656 [Nannochloropsis salina CCMP1776]|uniref:Uncharacterized protein n=1 Tax=Nannochloropsis salina CCMP1776 TaxID=1027361 RepID=A0A4D9D5H2_9STRA|nr:hypothetical protein NSK_003656 [Nannochloropsis salina CCMP1776]|eukprot:TFJ85233.1 hypothetical protein NSK_003656 [Nannochloropsis salina CCMP1776]
MPPITLNAGYFALLLALLLPTDAFVSSPVLHGVRKSADCRIWMSSAAVPPATEASPAAAAPTRPRREINILQVIVSNGGYMAKVEVKNFKDVTEHTVITSKELYQETCALAGKTPDELPIEDYYRGVFKFIISKGLPLTRTEGMIDAGVFPINYFSVSQLAIFLDDTVEGVAAELR